jgi:selenocysteine-specific elongation factor
VTLVVGTAGHIDHGKTTLLRAVTGIDADRLPEEQRRGMTIDVGYAWLALADGRTIDFVDVPGHERLVGNMLVGAGEIDAVLLVVAADDGPRAQTIEHLELVDALGLRRGVVAVTKSDVAEPGRPATVMAETEALLARTGLAGSPILAVSAATGEGLDGLRAAIEALAADDERTAFAAGARLAVDRVFAVRGRGIVVTGTLRGRIAEGDQLEVLPGGRRVRVREVQVHGRRIARSDGGRTALNVAGVGLDDLHRGHVLATPGAVTTTDRLLVSLRPPAPLRRAAPGLPADRARLRLHLGTEQVEGRVGRAGREGVDLPDGAATAILRLDRPIAAAVGDPFVLRRPSPGVAAAGGVVLDVSPPRGASRRRADPERIGRLVAAVQGHGPEAIRAARLDLHGALARGPSADLADDVRAGLAGAAVDAVEAHHGARPEDAGLPLAALRRDLLLRLRRQVTIDAERGTAAIEEVLARLVERGRLVRDGDRLRAVGHRPAGPSDAALAAMDRLVAILDAAAPPGLSDALRAAGADPTTVRSLERDGRIVRIDDDLAWATPAWERLARLALDQATRSPLTPADLRDATGTSRKYVMALLEDLGRRGVLTRTPAGHVPGPRAGVLRAGSSR